MRSVAAIVLAAGLSSRMGHFKPLLALNGENAADHVISLFVNSQVDVYLVTGWRQDELLAGIKDQDLTVVHNPNYQQGMFTSIQAGAGRLPEKYKSFFILPVDIPLVRPVTIQRLLEAGASSPDRIFYPVFNKKRGHPPLIPSGLIPSIMKWKEEGGLKSFLKAQESQATDIIVPDANIHIDMDCDSDYELIKSRFARLEIPSPEECEVIIRDIYALEPRLKRHCLKVAEVASLIGRKLSELGNTVDLGLIYAAAVLHDIAKGLPDHDVAGAGRLRDMGFGKTADIVAVHTDLANENGPLSLESKIVFLADKLAQVDKLVSVEERYREVAGRYGPSPEIKTKIALRLRHALTIKQELEELLGYSLESLLSSIN
jgi:molybdenum cofactor cytidylyltransferase